MSSTEVLLRPAEPDDAPGIAAVMTAARRAAQLARPPLMPPMRDGPGSAPDGRSDAQGFIRRRLEEWGVTGWVALAEQDPSHDSGDEPRVVGFALTSPGWLDDLYVDPGCARTGIGAALLDLVKSSWPAGFSLWVYQDNAPARRFYRRNGLLELEHTSGSGGPESAPDLRMTWPGNDPITYLRRQVDDVDSELAAVVARRLALTTAIQQVKDSQGGVAGHAARDPDREAEIAARLADMTPALTAEEWRRVVHELITVSLDAAERARREHADA